MGPQIEPKNKVSENTVIQTRQRNVQKRGTLYPLRKHTKGPHNPTLTPLTNKTTVSRTALDRRIYSPTCRGARSEASHLGTGRMSLLWAGPSLRDRCRSTSKKPSSVRWPLGACDPTHNKAYRHSVITITHTRILAHTRTNAKHTEG